MSPFNAHLALLCLLYSCGKRGRDLHGICLTLPCDERDQVLVVLSACQHASFSLGGNK